MRKYTCGTKIENVFGNKNKMFTFVYMAKNKDGIMTIRPSDPAITKQLIEYAEKKEWSLNKYVLHVLKLHIKQKSK